MKLKFVVPNQKIFLLYDTKVPNKRWLRGIGDRFITLPTGTELRVTKLDIKNIPDYEHGIGLRVCNEDSKLFAPVLELILNDFKKDAKTELLDWENRKQILVKNKCDAMYRVRIRDGGCTSHPFHGTLQQYYDASKSFEIQHIEILNTGINETNEFLETFKLGLNSPANIKKCFTFLKSFTLHIPIKEVEQWEIGDIK